MQKTKNSHGNDVNIRVPKKVAGGGAAGAVLGAVVAGPVGAVVGGAVGALVGNAIEKNFINERGGKSQKPRQKVAARKPILSRSGQKTASSNSSRSMTPSSRNKNPVQASTRSRGSAQKRKKK